ncbi:MAG TPA: polysaccharide biosynthesis/export family protein [Bryobacteraceae bacterium]|jgi:polysaccharide export outer membrane protein|nr:polysaccharide biosynthesis/export family protein [Bryobacteraceae bacterium]
MKKLLFVVLAALQLSAADAPTAPTTFRQRDQPYRLQPSDQLQISYRYTPEYDETFAVQPDGNVSIKLIGPVKLGGLTLDEAKTRLTEALKARLNDPEISLILQDFVKPSYVVIGQVSAPGKYEIHGNLTAIDGIALAGGFKDNAKHSQVILYRRVSDDLARTRILDLKKMMDPKHPDLAEDVQLQAGDLLVVPKNNVSKIADYVHWISVGTYFPLY